MSRPAHRRPRLRGNRHPSRLSTRSLIPGGEYQRKNDKTCLGCPFGAVDGEYGLRERALGASNTFEFSCNSHVSMAYDGRRRPSFAFAVPDDFGAFTSATVAVIPRSNVDATFDVYGSVRREGETTIESFFQDLGTPATLTAGEMGEIDITALLSASSTPPRPGPTT